MNPLTFLKPLLKNIRRNARLEPLRDWLVMLICACIVLVGIIVWNVWAFDTISRGGAIAAPKTEATPVFNRSSIDAIETIFSNRATEEAKYVTGVYRYADPSQ